MAATRYLRSTDGSNGDSGATWALAKATLAGIDAIDTTGDTLWVSQVHSESTAAAITFGFAGTAALPTKLLCGNDGAEPPTALATSAAVATTGAASNITLGGASVYCYGIKFTAGSSSNQANIIFLGATGQRNLFESCQFILGNTSTSSVITRNSAPFIGDLQWRNCDMKMGAAGNNGIIMSGYFRWTGGTALSGTSTPAQGLLGTSTADIDPGNVLLEDLDLSNFASTINLFNIRGLAVYYATIRNCKLPSGWSGNLTNGTFSSGQRFSMYNCNAGNVNYAMWIEDYSGTIKHEATITHLGGASDGVTPISWKMSTNANVVFPMAALKSDDIIFWNDVTNTAKTLTLQYLHDTNVAAGQGAGASNAFQNNEVWLEISYLSDSGSPLATFATTAPTVIATATDNTAGVGTAAWTTTGLTTPASGQLSVSFTPQQKGWVIARVCIGKASKTIYVDPEYTLT